MTKPRRKDQIRQLAQQHVEALKQRKGKTHSNDWRGKVLDALLHGNSLTSAAKLAGVKRARVYTECYSNPSFQRAFDLARYYQRNKFQFVSRPIWPPSPDTVQRHEATFQRIEEARRYELVGMRIWG